MKEITIKVVGLTNSGKTTILREIEKSLYRAGFEHIDVVSSEEPLAEQIHTQAKEHLIHENTVGRFKIVLEEVFIRRT